MADDCQKNRSLPEIQEAVSNTSQKRKLSAGDALKRAYSSVSFTPINLTLSCRPDSPRFFFSSSYYVNMSDLQSGKKREGVGDSDNVVDIDICQVVHRHVNGLCMVTVGELSIPSSKVLKTIRFIAKEAPPCSNASKRKRQAKMLKGKSEVENVVSPSTVIAELVLEERIIKQTPGESNTTDNRNDNTLIIPLRACLWGTVLELNSIALTPDVLLSDPLLDGFIAIILPVGEFPPQDEHSRKQLTQTYQKGQIIS